MTEPFLGEIRMFGGSFAPRGWALCDGQLLKVSQHDYLFSLIGTNYGGDGRTTFALPDLRGRVPVHKGAGPGLTSRTIGQRGGAETVALTVGEMPSHSHSLYGTSSAAAGSSGSNHILATNNTLKPYSSANPDANLAYDSIGSSGGNAAHNNMMPYQVLNYIIALVGLYPSQT